ncbi:MAG: hypothetical protein QOE35_3622 [Actinomycetota bacterium]
MVLLILAVIWAAVLIPPMLGARAEGRPADSIGDFRRQLSVLRRAAPVGTPTGPTLAAYGTVPFVAAPRTQSRHEAARRRTVKRRRDVFYALVTSMAGTLVLGLVPGMHVLLGLHVILDALFVAYVALLVRMRNAAAEREMKVRFLPHAASAPEPVFALRRSAN